MQKKRVNNTDFKLWLILLSAVCVVFSYYQLTFFWGNHDWDWVKGTTQVLSLNTGMFEGRYAKFILNVALFGGQILPILNVLLAFSLLALGGVLLVNYWQITDNRAKIMVALMPLLMPFILGWLFFPINILGNFAAVALVTSGLLLAENKKIAAKISAIICFLIALGVYPSVMEMMIICFCFRYILKPAKTKEILKNALPLIASLLIFKVILYILGALNLMDSNSYNLQLATGQELVNRSRLMIIVALKQMILTLPFINLEIRLWGLSLIILALIGKINQPKQIALWFVAFMTTVLTSWLTATPEETEYMPRINFYGLNFFYAGVLATVLTSKYRCKQNIGWLLCCGLLWSCITVDFEAQKVWYLGKTAEEQLVNRISERLIERNKAEIFIPVIAGELALRPRYYQTPYQKESPYLLNKPLMVRHIPSGMFNFYEPRQIFVGYSLIDNISEDLYTFIRTAYRPYPAESAIFTDNKYAVILLTAEGIAAIQAQLPK